MTDQMSRVIAECSKKIVRKEFETIKIESYDESLFDILDESVRQFGLHVMFPDFEGYLKRHGCQVFFVEAEEVFGRNKVLQGRHVAELMSDVPRELELIVQEVTKDA